MNTSTWPSIQYTIRLSSLSSTYEDVTALDDGDTSEAGSSQPWQQPARLYHTALDTLHDPFIGGGQGLTRRQLSMNHVYMHTLAPILLGTATNAPYSPAMFVTKTCLENSSVAAQLTAVLADELICALNGQPRTRDMMVQKSAANRAFKRALADHHKDFQAAYLGVLRLAQLSLLTHDIKTLRTVALAAEMLIDSMGGLQQALVLTPNIEPIYLVAYPFSRARIRTPEALEQILSRFLQSLQQILLWRNRVIGDREKLEEEIIAPIMPYILPASVASDTNMKASLMLLLELCWTIVVLSQEPKITTETLSYLALLRKSCPPPPSTDDGRGRYALSFSPVIAHARREILGRYDASKPAKYDFFITQMELDGMRIFDQVHCDGHITIIVKLYTWLTQPCADNHSLTNAELDDLKANIVNSWLREHGWRM